MAYRPERRPGRPRGASNSSSSRPFDDFEPRPEMTSRYGYGEYRHPQAHFDDFTRKPMDPYSNMPYPTSHPHQREQHFRRPDLEMAPGDGFPRWHGHREYFDPAQSYNPFVNGSLIYRFAHGDPLCVRCGTTGHLPRECNREALSWEEQHYLHALMRQEQERSKVERGLTPSEARASMERTPVPEPYYPALQFERPCHTEPYHPSLRREYLRHSPPEAEAMPSMEEFRRRHRRPPSEQELSPMSKLARDKEMQVERRPFERKPLESQEDQFGQFKAERKQSSHRRLTPTPPAPPPPPFSDAENMSPGFRISGMANEKASKKQQTRDRRKLDVKEDVIGAEKGSTVDFPPHIAAQRAPLTTPQPVATPANAYSQLRLISLQAHTMGANIRLPNGEAQAVGPHPSTIRVSARYLTQAAIEKYLSPASLDPQERSQAEARDDSLRLQGVAWIDNVRRALQLPVKTYTSACVFYHKFRLAHPFHEYSFADAAAASLLNACKAEDTLKKSRDILVAAYNLKQPAGHEQLSADDPIFDGPSRTIIGLERLVLESSSFDFTNRAPHDMLVKVAKSLPRSEDKKAVCQLGWTVLTDIHRTFAPLKQTSATLSLACLELAAHFKAATSPDNTCLVRDHLQELDLNRWHTTREEVMEILLDSLDMYTHHTTQTILGTQYSLDDFLRIRLALNKECTESNIPRHTIVQPPPSPDNANGATLRVSNGHPTPVSPPQPGMQVPPQPNGVIASLPIPEGGGTLRFMLNPQRATEERAQVSSYYTEEFEEYEEEIEVPIQRERSRDRHSDRDRDRRRDHPYDDRRSERDIRGPPTGPGGLRERDRDPLRDRERDAERERARLRDRERDRRYDDRRYDDRERDRRYDDRRERDRDRDRRYYDDDRRRRDDRR